VPVHDADAAVHRLYEGEAAPLIEAEFPGTTRNGKVDRAVLGKRVIGDPAALRRLETLVHPLVRDAEQEFLRRADAAGAGIAVLDIPLLYETGGDRRVDAVLVVTAPPSVQRARVLARGLTQERFEALLARQMPDAEKRRRADFVVDTSKGIDPARAQVQSILTTVARMPPKQK
jgi:dephospho-CoA kinase